MALSNAPTVLEENSDPKAFTSDVFKRENDDFPVWPILSNSPHGAWSSGMPQWGVWIVAYTLHFVVGCCYRALWLFWEVKLSIPGLTKGKKLSEYAVVYFLKAFDFFSKDEDTDEDTPSVADILTGFFWMSYFRLGEPQNFARDYTAAFCREYSEWPPISLFLDHGLHQYVPYDDEWDDKKFLIHLVSFYNVARFTGKPFESMGLRVIRRIDIARLQDGPVVGKRECVLDLGTSGPEGRPIHWLTHLLKMPDNQHHYIIDQLKENNVVCKEDTKDRKCLDVIRTYKTSYVSLAVCIPTILSLVIGIVWTSVAATVYSQEVQVSAQTAFTISSYIVTAGSLLIALIAYLDGIFESSSRDSQAVKNIDVHKIVALSTDKADHAPPPVEEIDPQVDDPAHSAQASVRADDADAANDTALPIATPEKAYPRRKSESDAGPARALEGASSTISLPKTAVSLPPGFV